MATWMYDVAVTYTYPDGEERLGSVTLWATSADHACRLAAAADLPEGAVRARVTHAVRWPSAAPGAAHSRAL